MREQQLDALLARQSNVVQRTYRAIRDSGPLSDSDLRRLLNRGSSFTKQLDRLQALGYIRALPGREPRRYETVPLDEIESTRERMATSGTPRTQADRVLAALLNQGRVRESDFKGETTLDGRGEITQFYDAIHQLKKRGYRIDKRGKQYVLLNRVPSDTPQTDEKPRSRNGGRRVPAGRAEQHRKMEHGDYETWYRTRRRLIELARTAAGVEPMAFWNQAPSDELAETLEELLDARDAIVAVIEAIEIRNADDAIRAKIDLLREENGRTPGEIATARRLIKRQERKIVVA